MFDLAGYFGTAALYRLYITGECVVNVKVSECVELVELYYTTPPCGVAPHCNLEHWVNYCRPISLGECAKFDGVISLYTPELLEYSILSQPKRGKYDTTT